MRGSFVIPAYNREDTIDRAVRSIAQQGLGGYEIIIIDDMSTDDTRKKIIEWENRYPENIIGLKFPDHAERVVSFNAGINTARGDWIIMLDSDDELASHFIKAFEQARTKYPEVDIFTWNSLVHFNQKEYERTEVRKVGELPKEADGTVGVFKSGPPVSIYSGGFAFKKMEAYRRGFLPEAGNPYSFGERFLKWYPELVPLYGEGKTDIGNPWGQDFAWFYHLTRKLDANKVIHLPQILHFQHVRP